MRDISGRNAATSQELRSVAKREGWKLEVLDMDVTDDVSERACRNNAGHTRADVQGP
jgi:hypothetical protein